MFNKLNLDKNRTAYGKQFYGMKEITNETNFVFM